MNVIGGLVSPQALEIYNLLLSEGAMTAKDIGQRLDILPNAVYRTNKQLLAIGVVEKSQSYPVVFSVVPVTSAIGWFLIEAQRSFKQTFGVASKHTLPVAPRSITFVKNRTTLLKKTDEDVANAKQAVSFIVSGLEVPDETILAYRKAVTKGVAVRVLIQKRQTSNDKLEKWQDIGATIRQTDDLALRLFIIDSRIVYITSYNQKKKEEAFGIRFEYPPFAALMNDIFEAKWQAAS